jgi:murein DD-endopeptidase MepM/ murein hydrolase activator NlpD
MPSLASVAAYRALAKRRCWLLLALVAPAAGCSADVTRFDFPAFGIADNGGSPTGALPTPSASLQGTTTSTPSPSPSYTPGSGPTYTPSSSASYSPSSAPSYTPSYASPSREALAQPPRGSGLIDAPSAYGRGAEPPPEARGAPPSKDASGHPPERGAERPRIATSGETVEVRPGDTLHGIARRHGVPIGSLIDVNGLGDGAALKPGQRLLLPVGATPRASAPERATNPPAGWEGHHTLQAGESLYAVARQYHVELGELQRVNGIADPTKVRAGTPLSVPRGEGLQPASPPAEAGPRAPPPTAPSTGQPEAVKSSDLGNRADDAGASLDKFRWPARGRVIAPFGTRPDGTHNDGINIAVPLGTEIHAAESGRVAYAGNELKGYGNLVLIRHDGGWVSAYAHADQILVKRDEVVRRGQVIAHAGKTGSVDQPQLHFELRHGAKPVDPLPYLSAVAAR